jgi:tRNA threonylcarbamoyladenosine biosynthesis protein TsaB
VQADDLDVNLLAVDTATPVAALAVIPAGGRLPQTAATDPAARHGRALLPSIRALLEEAGLTPRQLGGIVVGLGPGSYTGLRVGVTACKIMAYALGMPLVGIDSLELIACNAPGRALRISVIGDAQRGDLYAADFGRAEEGAPLCRLSETRVIALDVWAAELPGDAFVLGPALTVPRLAAAVPRSAARDDDPAVNLPDPRRLAEFARDAWRSGRREEVFFLEPIYLRRSAAEEQWDRKAPAS